VTQPVCRPTIADKIQGAEMPQGMIKKITDKGFGFIEGDRGDLFFHCSEVQDGAFEDLREGQMVEYEVGRGKKGPCATGVRATN